MENLTGRPVTGQKSGIYDGLSFSMCNRPKNLVFMTGRNLVYVTGQISLFVTGQISMFVTGQISMFVTGQTSIFVTEIDVIPSS